jgi:hypothetical protein
MAAAEQIVELVSTKEIELFFPLMREQDRSSCYMSVRLAALARQITFRNKIPRAPVLRRPVSINGNPELHRNGKRGPALF